MNKQRRQRLSKPSARWSASSPFWRTRAIRNRIVFDSLPDNLQETERAQSMEEAIDQLSDAIEIFRKRRSASSAPATHRRETMIVFFASPTFLTVLLLLVGFVALVYNRTGLGGILCGAGLLLTLSAAAQINSVMLAVFGFAP